MLFTYLIALMVNYNDVSDVREESCVYLDSQSEEGTVLMAGKAAAGAAGGCSLCNRRQEGEVDGWWQSAQFSIFTQPRIPAPGRVC